mmetsp:Transcript_65311/g.154284  ORF Transcript_65311/g.154284 Transcript_65311/m.154284 type:complete len:270 (+) Transcript_65311:83-892(+)
MVSHGRGRIALPPRQGPQRCRGPCTGDGMDHRCSATRTMPRSAGVRWAFSRGTKRAVGCGDAVSGMGDPGLRGAGSRSAAPWGRHVGLARDRPRGLRRSAARLPRRLRSQITVPVTAISSGSRPAAAISTRPARPSTWPLCSGSSQSKTVSPGRLRSKRRSTSSAPLWRSTQTSERPSAAPTRPGSPRLTRQCGPEAPGSHRQSSRAPGACRSAAATAASPSRRGGAKGALQRGRGLIVAPLALSTLRASPGKVMAAPVRPSIASSRLA